MFFCTLCKFTLCSQSAAWLGRPHQQNLYFRMHDRFCNDTRQREETSGFANGGLHAVSVSTNSYSHSGDCSIVPPG